MASDLKPETTGLQDKSCAPKSCAPPELLAPAGDWECARAAVENGADAIYFGLEKFNARMRAHNFTESDLPRLMEFLHRRGVKGYVTFNTLVFENELKEAEQYLRAIIAAGVDAAIVQDVGICRLIRQLSPDFPIHISTQMTITSAAGIDFARELGASLVVLARECSLKEIEKLVRPAGADERKAALPLEVFVHGALCVAYSGQCLTSEALGGRSANRGECAQACRLPYELIADGQVQPLGDRKYLLSPQDLAGLELLPELARLGVASLKIEGRLKSPEYVANITRVYRGALNRLNADELPGSDARYDLEMAFSRGLYTGWFRGINNQELVHGRFGKKRGVYLGEVGEVRHDGVVLDLVGPLKPGDGIVFDAGHPEEPEEGGRVYAIEPIQAGRPKHSAVESGGARVLLSFGRGDLELGRVHRGDKVWKTSDPELDRRLRRTFEGDQPRFQRPLQLEVYGQAGERLVVIARDELGHVVKVESSVALTPATQQPVSTERLREQLGRLGGSGFSLAGLENRLEGALMIPVSELNRLRRQFVAELESLRAEPKRWALSPPSPNPNRNRNRNRNPDRNPSNTASPRAIPNGPSPDTATLIVLVRNLSQLRSVLACGIQTVYCEFENPKHYIDAVEQVRRSGIAGAEIFVAPPRIFKSGEEWTLKQVQLCQADGYLARNYDHLTWFASHRRVGDFSLNIANHLTADYFKNRFGLERLTASYDLNTAQLEALVQAAPPEWFEVTIHQHMPMFHMEHCLFCAFLSSGTDYTNCGRPCDRHEVKLRDRVGAEHPVKADVGCRNTVFNALAQTGAEFVGPLQALGVRRFRVEFLNETPEQIARTIAMYGRLLRGEISGTQLWRELKLVNQLGVTRGPEARGQRAEGRNQKSEVRNQKSEVGGNYRQR